MSASPMAGALAPLARRMGTWVREQEILRVVATIRGDPTASAETARRATLAWAQNRAGGARFTEAAWDGHSFESFVAGRNVIAVRIQGSEGDIWALRAEDPDSTAAQRIWTTEVVIGHLPDRPASFGLRLLASTSEPDLTIDPTTPGLVRQVMDACGLFCGRQTMRGTADIIMAPADSTDLIDLLADPERARPVFVVSLPMDAADPAAALIDADALARRCAGLAQVVVAGPEVSWELTKAFEKKRSVFDGAVRAYMPGFDAGADPYAHRLVLGAALREEGGPAQCTRWLQKLAAEASLRASRLGADVLDFATVRKAQLNAEARRITREGGGDSARLEAAVRQIAGLEQELDENARMLAYYEQEFDEERARAEAAETQLRAGNARIQTLMARLEAEGQDPDAGMTLPESWTDFADWCDEALAGRLALTPSARRSLKAPAFGDPATAARCLLWLATICRDRRLNGGGSLRDELVQPGIRNCLCGGDAYDVSWQGRPYTADWHIKNGGNTRDPAHCLRIYYFWDDASQQIVVSDMPAHRVTAAT